MLSPSREETSRFFRFCCVGATNCLVDYAVFMGLSLLVPIYVARTLSWCTACLYSYLVNRRWTFRASDKGAAPLLRFTAVNTLSLGLGLTLLHLFTVLGCGPSAAFWLSLPFTTLANFLGYRFWSFKDIG